MKKLYLTSVILFICFICRADEGMWLPSLIESRMVNMQANGLKLSAEDIYSVNQACLKDAIVQFGGGCSAELISDKGLILTNHHCGFGQIQSHSSVEHDYLKDGFWAKNLDEELPNKGLTVKFLLRMEDVTAQIVEGVDDTMSKAERSKKIKANEIEIIKKATEGTSLSATVDAIYYGNQYFLFVYETFKDIRLVGAPPSSIGKFGGDTDNWVWPRHTGDFSLFRIYAGKDNKPAPYSKDNVPYKPKKSLRISLKGIQENDFTFVYGYPGRTTEYLYSDAVKYIVERGNPAKIKLRTIRLDIMKAEMDKNVETRIKYASKQAGVANAWKKWQGELKGLIRLKTVQKKQALERQFSAWASTNSEYNDLVPRFSELYGALNNYAFARDYQMEAFNVVEAIRFASYFTLFTNKKRTTADSVLKKQLQSRSDSFFKDYLKLIDQQTFVALLNEYVQYMPAEFMPPAIDKAVKKHKGNIQAWANELYTKTLFVSKDAVNSLLDQPTEKLVKQLNNDPLFILYKESDDFYKEKVEKRYNEINAQITELYRYYMRGLMAMQPDRAFYPDANFTMRIAYGKVNGYTPADAVYYMPVSTIDGIMEKDNPDIYDYDIPQRLRDVYATKDYGRWEVNGTVPVAFIATNHTTGGNSGSPVLNANGDLIGLNFDRTWESTMSDVEYDPSICRNIALDIRYALFVIDKIAGAGYLLDEMIFVE
jgi:hypothetical protein